MQGLLVPTVWVWVEFRRKISSHRDDLMSAPLIGILWCLQIQTGRQNRLDAFDRQRYWTENKDNTHAQKSGWPVLYFPITISKNAGSLSLTVNSTGWRIVLSTTFTSNFWVFIWLVSKRTADRIRAGLVAFDMV